MFNDSLDNVDDDTPLVCVVCGDNKELRTTNYGMFVCVGPHLKNRLYESRESTNATLVEKCRHAPTKVFNSGGFSFYGGSVSKIDLDELDRKWLVVSLLGEQTKNPVRSTIFHWTESLTRYCRIPQVVLDWPDYGIPPVKPGFWLRLCSLSRKYRFKNVLFYCIGGHGRTGTALSSVLVEVDGLTAVEAVNYVRANYCKNAVESQEQVNYLKSLENWRKQNGQYKVR